MNALIGGSPSTGSSLFRQMLNRHSKIYCGPETRLFAHPELFKKWDRYKQNISRDRSYVPDIYLQKGFNLVGEEQCVDQNKLAELVSGSHSLREFSDAYFTIPMFAYGKSVVCEKTPANVFSFEIFLDTFSDGKVIHVTRDPKDVITSLMNRGHSLFEATGRWLLSTAHAMANADDTRYTLVKYENLIINTERELVRALACLGLNIEVQMIQAGNPNMAEVDKMSGWLNSELSIPSEKSIGRFQNQAVEFRNSILRSLEVLRIDENYASKHGLPMIDARGISESLGYEFIESPPTSQKIGARLGKERSKNRIRSALRGHLFSFRESPLVIAVNKP